MIQYKIKKGDTLTAISKQFGVTVSSIVEANKNTIKNPNLIEIGWILNIPDIKQADYNALGEAVEKCLGEIEKLNSFKELVKLL